VTVHLDGVTVPDDAVLGDPAGGLRQAMLALDVGRAGIGAQAVGIARAALEHATAYALEREQFNHPIADFGAIQEKLAEMAARVEGARALVHSAGSLLGARSQEGRSLPAGDRTAAARAAMAKLLASRTAMWVTDEAVQVFGGYGYMRDYPVEKLMRDAKGTEIYEGTSEILRVVIARELLGRARTGR
jgi:butyryl-CoA dehydrogenase